jgi:hypothetical protein
VMGKEVRWEIHLSLETLGLQGCTGDHGATNVDNESRPRGGAIVLSGLGRHTSEMNQTNEEDGKDVQDRT